MNKCPQKRKNKKNILIILKNKLCQNKRTKEEIEKGGWPLSFADTEDIIINEQFKV